MLQNWCWTSQLYPKKFYEGEWVRDARHHCRASQRCLIQRNTEKELTWQPQWNAHEVLLCISIMVEVHAVVIILLGCWAWVLTFDSERFGHCGKSPTSSTRHLTSFPVLAITKRKYVPAGILLSLSHAKYMHAYSVWEGGVGDTTFLCWAPEFHWCSF